MCGGLLGAVLTVVANKNDWSEVGLYAGLVVVLVVYGIPAALFALRRDRQRAAHR